MIKQILPVFKNIKQLNKALPKANIHSSLSEPLQQQDPEMYDIIQQDIERQRQSINLLSNENTPSKATISCVGSIMNAKYSEGYPGQRYYGGTQFIDEIELLAQQRALDLFQLNKSEWSVNVQPISVNMANMAALTALLPPHGRVMMLKGSNGGSNGVGMDKEIRNGLEKYFEVLPYFQTRENYIDYDELKVWAIEYRPLAITIDPYSYGRKINWQAMRDIADSVGAYLVSDITHQSDIYCTTGLQEQSPFEFCDVVTTSTQGHLRGNNGALLFYKQNLKEKIDQTLFPGLQGGPHNHSITGVACTLKEAQQDYYKQYIEQSQQNMKALLNQFGNFGYKILTNGTDYNIAIINTRQFAVNGFQLENIADRVRIYVGRCNIKSDEQYNVPHGIKLSPNYMTSRGLVEKDFVEVAKFFKESVDVTKEIISSYGYDYDRVQFQKWIYEEYQNFPRINNLRKNVMDFGKQFPLEY